MKGIKLVPKILAFLLIAVTLISINSCQRAGLGGNSEVRGYIMHFDDTIYGASIHIGLNDKDQPGRLETDYDYMEVTQTDGLYVISNLEKGNYYLFARGYDHKIAEFVEGGVAIKLGANDLLTLDIPVDQQ